jgi:nucleoside 2-deoxyribosyltransferase
MPDCLVLMPFRKDLYSRFLCVKKCGEQLGLTVYRVDRYKFSGNIIEAISKAIKHADVVVADLIGSNPNVMYELAIAQSLGKRVLIIGDKTRPARCHLKIHPIHPKFLTRQLRSIWSVSSPR